MKDPLVMSASLEGRACGMRASGLCKVGELPELTLNSSESSRFDETPNQI